MVPVTTYRQSFYWEPVTTCCQTPCPSPCPPPCNGTPAVSDQQSQPGVRSFQNGGPGVQQYDDRPMPPAGGASSQRQLTPQAPNTAGRPAPVSSPPPKVKLDRIVAIPDHNVEGQVVRNDRAQANAKVLFVSADRQGDQRTLTTDSFGKFRVTLASGGWLVYVHGADGKPVFHSKINVCDDRPSTMTLTSR
jgi:hypothetical protein